MAWTAPRTWVAGEVLTAALLNTHLRDNLLTLDTFTDADPTLSATTTPPTLSDDASHTVDGNYLLAGGLCIYWFYVAFGTSGVAAGSGNYTISLPVATAMSNGWPIGSGWIRDSSGTDRRLVTVTVGPTNQTAYLYAEGADIVTDASPWTWADSDQILGFMVYES